jgi:hypothetical protein
MRDWRARAEYLADELAAKGALRTRPWREAVVNAPRHELVQDYYEYDHAESGTISRPRAPNWSGSANQDGSALDSP